MRAVILAVALSLVSACSGSGHWIGDGVEAVDGFWVMRERPCDDPGCWPARRVALAAIGDPDGSTVANASVADWTRDFAFDDGRSRLSAVSPAIGVTLFAVILDLADGTRRLVPVRCAHTETVPPVLSDCEVDDNGHWYNGVGNEPWLQPQAQL